MASTRDLFRRRRMRLRAQLHKKSGGRPRLSVHRTRQHIYAQLIDDDKNRTVAAASTLDETLRGKSGGNIAAAEAVGKLIAERAKKAGIDRVVFDRGGYIYHGRVRALAEAAREGGLNL